MVVVQTDTDLLEIALTLAATGSLASLLDGRQKQGDQNRDNRDDHQQLDERETAAAFEKSERFHGLNSPEKYETRTLEKWRGWIEVNCLTRGESRRNGSSENQINP